MLRVCGTHRRKVDAPVNLVTLADVAGWPPDGLARRPWCPAGRYGQRELLEALEPPPPPIPAPSRPKARRPGDYGPANAVGELSWRQILEPLGWSLAGTSTMDGAPCELWRRPGNPASPYSLKAIIDGPAVVWSDAVGLPTGVGLTPWQVYCHVRHGGDQAAAGRAIRRRAVEMAG